MKKAILVLVTLCAIGLSLVVYTYPGAAICAASSFAGVRNAEIDNVIVGREFSDVDTNDFIAKNIEARAKIKRDHWALESNPEILLLSGKPVFGFLSYNQYGSMSALPGKTCVFIGPDGNKVDVIAHELVHADIANHLGYIKYRSFPSWLNEGIAMQVDSRERYKFDAINNADPNYIKAITGGEFYKDGTPQVVSNYSAAKYVVSEWIKENGLDGLPKLVELGVTK